MDTDQSPVPSEDPDGTSKALDVEILEAELGPLVAAEFANYRVAKLAGTERQLPKLVQLNFHTPESAAASLEKERKRLAAMDFLDQIAELVNNFHLWLPGGWYREFLEKKLVDAPDAPGTILRQRLVTSIDTILRQKGYAGINAQNLSSFDRTSRLLIEADVYFALRQQHFDSSLLSQ